MYSYVSFVLSLIETQVNGFVTFDISVALSKCSAEIRIWSLFNPPCLELNCVKVLFVPLLSLKVACNAWPFSSGSLRPFASWNWNVSAFKTSAVVSLRGYVCVHGVHNVRFSIYVALSAAFGQSCQVRLENFFSRTQSTVYLMVIPNFFQKRLKW